jgi:hypothetical protein
MSLGCCAFFAVCIMLLKRVQHITNCRWCSAMVSMLLRYAELSKVGGALYLHQYRLYCHAVGQRESGGTAFPTI